MPCRAGENPARGKIMPIHYERDDVHHRIVVTSVGSLTLDEALAVIDRQAAEGAWSYGVLYDARAAAAAPTASDVHQLLLRVGTLTAKHGPRGRVALVVLDPKLSKMGRRYANLGDLTSLVVCVFGSLEEADRWLMDGQTMVPDFGVHQP
jgi:hypothetical protein